MNIIAMLWGKTTGLIVGAIAIIAALAGIRYQIRKGARDEMSAEIKDRTIEQIARNEEIDADIDGMSDGDVIASMRKQGYVRD